MAGFTKGPYSPGASSDAGLVVWSGDTIVAGFPGPTQSEMGVSDRGERKANRKLVLAAFHFADALESLGYDGQAAIEALPEMVDALTELYEHTADYIRVNKLGDVHHNVPMQKARDALARIRKGGE